MPSALFINNAISLKYQRPIIHFRQPFLYGHKWRGEKEQTVLQTHLRFRRRRRRMVLKKKILRFHSIGLFVAVRVSFNIVRFGHINRKRRGRSCQLGTLSPSSDHREICKKKSIKYKSACTYHNYRHRYNSKIQLNAISCASTNHSVEFDLIVALAAIYLWCGGGSGFSFGWERSQSICICACVSVSFLSVWLCCVSCNQPTSSDHKSQMAAATIIDRRAGEAQKYRNSTAADPRKRVMWPIWEWFHYNSNPNSWPLRPCHSIVWELQLAAASGNLKCTVKIVVVAVHLNVEC